MDGVNNWMNEIDVFLMSEDAALGDSETLQAQLTESEVRTLALLTTIHSEVVSVTGRSKRSTCCNQLQYDRAMYSVHDGLQQLLLQLSLQRLQERSDGAVNSLRT